MAQNSHLITTPDLQDTATLDDLMADRKLRPAPYNISLHELVAQQSRQDWMRSVFIDPSFCTGVEEYDGALGDAYVLYGAQAVYNAVCTHLAAAIPKLVSRGYFDEAADLSYHEVCFYTHDSDYMPVSVLTFTADGGTYLNVL